MNDANTTEPEKSAHKTEKAPKKRKRRRLPNWLRPAEAESLVAAGLAAVGAARTRGKRLCATRDLLMVRSALGSGFRVSELCNLQVPELDLADGTALVLHGKGDKDRMVPVPAKLLPDLAAWLGNRTTGYLFPGPKGRRLGPRTFQTRIKTLALAAGIVRRIHPHVLRHTFATMLLRSSGNLRVVQTILGHSSIATTELYTHLETAQLKEAVDRL